MQYLVTGATGFIGRYLIENLLHRRGTTVYALTRKSSLHKIAQLRKDLGVTEKRLVAITGDLTRSKLGIAKKDLQTLQAAGINHMFHLAALYDMTASDNANEETNIGGTRHALEAASALGAGCFHHVSSIAAAGLYKGTFREDMFDEAGPTDHPYLRTKHDSEALVRETCKGPYRIYRPGMVVGHSQTGHIDKIDGPYYSFKFIQKMRYALPQWMPTIGVEGGYLNIVPVDFVADSIDHIAHKKGLDGQCFHITDPKPHKAGDVLNIFSRAAHAPQMSMRVDLRMLDLIPQPVKMLAGGFGPVQRIKRTVLEVLSLPEEVLGFLSYPTKFDSSNTQKVLEGSGISCPDLASYAPVIWDYWERNLDPDLHLANTLHDRVDGKVVVITGATSGIGKATALALADTDATIVLVARTPAKLEDTQSEIEALGGRAIAYQCDVSDLDSCDRLVKQVIKDHGRVDILVNNAGRSIRRSIAHSLDRFHDFERTMQLNYFGALRLINGFIPTMLEQRSGHIINISSIGVLTNAPRFSAYVSSKAALDAYSRCAATEFSDKGIRFTTINMPLVRTPMIAPTNIYKHFPALSPEEAADLIIDAIVHQQKRIATRLGIAVQVMHFIQPKMTEVIMNMGFSMFGDSSAAKGKKKSDAPQAATSEQIAFSYLMRGIHW